MGEEDKTETGSFTSIIDLKIQKDAVCKIEYKDDENNSASGFFATYCGYYGIMTNRHVIKNKEECSLRIPVFKYQKSSEFRIDLQPEIFYYSPENLDCTFVACQHDIILKRKIFAIDLTKHKKKLRKDHPVHIYQHPAGRPKEKSQSWITGVEKNVIWYNCDTQGGSSGSPVFTGALLAGLHHAGRQKQGKTGRMERFNEAMKMSAIVAHLQSWIVKKADTEDNQF